MNSIYKVSPELSEAALNELFASAWPRHRTRSFAPILRHSLSYLCAYQGERLIGFVNLAWDGGMHGFILDTTVHPAFQGQGIGRGLVRSAVDLAVESGLVWLHVDYEARLEPFYTSCGFKPSRAGIMNLKDKPYLT